MSNAVVFEEQKDQLVEVLSTLEARHVALCDQALKEEGFIAPNLIIIASIIYTSNELVERLQRYADLSAHLESADRDLLLNAFSMFYIQQGWPPLDTEMEVFVEFIYALMERTSETNWGFTA